MFLLAASFLVIAFATSINAVNHHLAQLDNLGECMRLLLGQCLVRSYIGFHSRNEDETRKKHSQIPSLGQRPPRFPGKFCRAVAPLCFLTRPKSSEAGPGGFEDGPRKFLRELRRGASDHVADRPVPRHGTTQERARTARTAAPKMGDASKERHPNEASNLGHICFLCSAHCLRILLAGRYLPLQRVVPAGCCSFTDTSRVLYSVPSCIFHRPLRALTRAF